MGYDGGIYWGIMKIELTFGCGTWKLTRGKNNKFTHWGGDGQPPNMLCQNASSTGQKWEVGGGDVKNNFSIFTKLIILSCFHPKMSQLFQLFPNSGTFWFQDTWDRGRHSWNDYRGWFHQLKKILGKRVDFTRNGDSNSIKKRRIDVHDVASTGLKNLENNKNMFLEKLEFNSLIKKRWM